MIDVIVVGGGPAGLTAATYLHRFHRSCLVLDAGESRARWIPESNNCPGFPHGVSGKELLRRMREQAGEVGLVTERAVVDGIRPLDGGFEVTAGEHSWRARKVILASGVSDRLPEGPWVADAIARGALRLCSVCDAYEASDLVIGVHGPADEVGGHALFLLGYSDTVRVLPSDGGDGGDGGDAGRRSREAGAEWLPGGGRLAFDGEKCSYVPLEGAPITLDTVYAYLGSDTSAGIAAAAGAALTDEGEIIVDGDQQTRLPGLYAIGDVVSGLNQISVAVGHAAIAATHAHNALPFAARRQAGKQKTPLARGFLSST
ncbi:NAD(P)/FAD-dependent oxidoreductase [Luteimonas changyuni]|uniref:NAD(P)/FAD-dependent oxidoreductase n=1 Tax=Luteimonas sp. MJ145 TaxID=3129234 RepID=UPI0031BAECE1